MSELGQKQTSSNIRFFSALEAIADIDATPPSDLIYEHTA
jgi:hypothetical protein